MKTASIYDVAFPAMKKVAEDHGYDLTECDYPSDDPGYWVLATATRADATPSKLLNRAIIDRASEVITKHLNLPDCGFNPRESAGEFRLQVKDFIA